MYELHGWIELYDGTRSNVASNKKGVEENIRWLMNALTRHDLLGDMAELLSVNDRHVLTLHAHVNRRRAEANNMMEVIREVVGKFKYAEGLIYEYDSANTARAVCSLYTVLVIKDGCLYRRQDPFLSPAYTDEG